jgi:anti-sigma regulatory factor (Ser/Thr protein kinase)
VGEQGVETLFSRAKQGAIRLRLHNEPDATSKLRRALDHVARASGLAADATFDLKLAATEALTNAVKGAPEDHVVDVAIEGSDGAVEVEVTDRRDFRPAFGGESALEAESGRGIPLMLALTDAVEFTSVRGGVRIRLRRVSA